LYKYGAKTKSDTFIRNSNEEREMKEKLVVDVVGIGLQVIDVQLVTHHCKIIDGKEVEVSTEEDMLESNMDEKSPKVSLEKITCIDS
jgi:hypothetical protein